jgi:diguanylate cyclase (GGDEF)-like protein/PAS domain S-box-containing protein
MERKYIESLQQVIEEKEQDLKVALDELTEKTAYLDNILCSSIDMGIVATDTQFQVAYYNPAAQDILGVQAKDIVGRHIEELELADNPALSRFERAAQAVEQSKVYSFSFDKQGLMGRRFIQARVSGTRDRNGRLVGYVLMLHDVSDTRKAQETIHHMAYHDYLTDLPNRLLFNERLQMELARSERNGMRLALMVVDLDRFKAVNDSYGHHTGDVLLKLVADRLRHRLRKSDTVARMGGDEFTIILPEISKAEDAVLVADKLSRLLSSPYVLEGQEVQVGASVGVAVYPLHGNAQNLLKLADKAMYQAKRQARETSRGAVTLFSGEDAEAETRLSH